MIAKLTGKLIEVFPSFVIIDVNGVGYQVEGYIPTTDLQNDKVSVYIFTYVREQEIRLFGFHSKEELLIFQQLLTVSGVGPKAALALVNNLGVDSIISAISNSDAKVLRVSGVGWKTAEKIIIDLRTKINKLAFKLSDKPLADSKAVNEITGVLVALGYTQKEIAKATAGLDFNEDQSQLIKKALNYLRSIK